MREIVLVVEVVMVAEGIVEVHSVESPFVLKFRHAMPSHRHHYHHRHKKRELQKRARWVS